MITLARLLLTALLLFVSVNAKALEYTDIWSTPAEPGWGVLLVQSDTFQFAAFYVYDHNNNPHWFTAQLTFDAGTGKYTGGLYDSTGTFWLMPWNQSQQNTRAAGTVTFQPIDLYHATLSYTLTGEGSVTKPIQRLPLTPYMMGGSYSGSLSGTVTGCMDSSMDNPAVRGRYNLAVTQTGDSSATLNFTFVDPPYSGMACTLSGPLTHYGTLYQMGSAQYTCTGPGFSPDATSGTATLDSFHPTAHGIEGHWTVQAGGCSQSLRFAAVRN